MKKLVVALVGLAALTACSGGNGAESGALPMPSGHSELDIAQAVGDKNGDGYVRMDGTRCQAAVYLDSPDMVSLYAGAGDVVATNPEQTAGVKVVDATAGADDNQERCHALFTDALADLD